MLKISNLACELLRHNISSLGLETIRSFYKAALSKKGYITRKGNIRFKDLIIDFKNFFNNELLFLLESSIQKETDTWLHKLLRKPRVTCHPIRHILFLLFLDADINNLLNIKKELQPFGKGPWFCLNPAIDHFHKQTIKDCRISYCTHSNLPIGMFSCSCGFTYLRKGPDKTWADKFRKDRVYSFGEVWIAECKKVYKNPELSLREKSRRMGVDPKTFIRYSTSICVESSVTKTVKPHIELEKRTKRLLENINNHLTPARSIIRQENPRDYIWHYRNNREWLYSILPKNSTRINKQRIDWLKVDNEMLGPVRSAINNIFKYDGKPIRVTRAEISRRVENPNIIEYSLNKLPKTREVISSFIESTEEYQIRRINWVFDNWKKDIELSMWRFKREVGINKESEFIKKYLKILFS
nr:TnsD family Tn7-like transposition protein [Mesobacillus subterraneus]